MKQNCFSLRPGTIMGYKGGVWKVISNDTLDRTFTIEPLNERANTGRKKFRYAPGQEVEVRWTPDERR